MICLHFVERLVVAERRRDSDEARIVQLRRRRLRPRAPSWYRRELCPDGRCRRRPRQNAGEDFQRGRIRMRHGRGVIRDHELLAFADAAEFHVAFAVLRRLDGVGLVQFARGARNRAERAATTAERLRCDRIARRCTSTALSGW